MIRNKFTDDRGQVGIGTLIVFIALVLVAAIAAGVLINTAGFLQTQAEQTGEDSSSQVANNINVIGEVGDVNSDASGVNVTRLTVQRSPGSDNVDLTELSIQYVGDNGFANLIHASKKNLSTSNSDPIDNLYYLEVITASSTTDGVMTDDSDRYQIIIPFNGADAINDEFYDIDPAIDTSDDDIRDALADDVNSISDLSTGSEAEMEITTADRATRNAFIQVPDTIEDDETSITL